MVTDHSDAGVAALFLFHQGHLQDGGGGVQIASHEYFETLRMAGLRLKPLEIPFDRRLWVRARRLLWPNPYRNFFNPWKVIQTIRGAQEEEAHFIFLNQRSLAPLAKLLRDVIPLSSKIVLLSHGLESVDYLHKLRADGFVPFARVIRRQVRLLGWQLVEESKQNIFLDHIFCLSPFDVEIERWLGARSVSYLPRTIMTRSINWQPHYGRLGFVGRVDHPPNAEGLILFLEALQKMAPPDVRLRVVGRPYAIGQAIARRFPVAEYLGVLSDRELEEEASTWTCFVHPLFCCARGCSTKLGVALGWNIPVVTTTYGCRGYTWREGRLPVAESPAGLVELALRMLDLEAARRARAEICKIARSGPTVAEVAELIRSSLSLPALIQRERFGP